MMRNANLYLLMMFVFGLGCNRTNEVVQPVQQTTLSMTFSNLPRLGEGEGHYQLWARFVIFNRGAGGNSLMHDSAAVSLGEFNISADGHSLVAPDGSSNPLIFPSDQNPQLLDDIVLTIQGEEGGLARVNHGDPGPAVLGGKVAGDASIGVADLTMSYALALGNTFQSVNGSFTITAPTSPADSNSGVWFILPGATTTAGLQNLPVLPEGWTYEGWVGMPDVGGSVGQYFSTGKFLNASGADADSAGPGRGIGTGLNFPGQDFIVAYSGGPGATPNLRIASFMVTIEPVPDNSVNPFGLKLLSSGLPASAPWPRAQAVSMNNAVSAFPHARVTIVRSGN